MLENGLAGTPLRGKQSNLKLEREIHPTADRPAAFRDRMCFGPGTGKRRAAVNNGSREEDRLVGRGGVGRVGGVLVSDPSREPVLPGQGQGAAARAGVPQVHLLVGSLIDESTLVRKSFGLETPYRPRRL